VLALMSQAVAQSLAAFDAAAASSVYSSKSFGAALATTESSGYWCSAGNHAAGQIVSWTGTFKSRRQMLGMTLRWTYAPAEFKVLTSADGGNFQQSAGWRKVTRAEPSFEESVLFSEPVSAAAVTVLMRGAKPWGYFGLSSAAAVVGPSAFMLVSGAAGAQEQCLLGTRGSLVMKPCVDAIVEGSGAEIFSSSKAGQLQTSSGLCLGVLSGKLSAMECEEGKDRWTVTGDGQVKLGNTCLAVAGSEPTAADCDDAAMTGADKFFQVAVPEHDPMAAVAVQEVGALLRASVQRQQALVAALQKQVPRLASCKSISLAVNRSRPVLARTKAGAAVLAAEPLSAKVGASFGPSAAELGAVLGTSADVLSLVAGKAR
jgi:hypothetical protein